MIASTPRLWRPPEIDERLAMPLAPRGRQGGRVRAPLRRRRTMPVRHRPDCPLHPMRRRVATVDSAWVQRWSDGKLRRTSDGFVPRVEVDTACTCCGCEAIGSHLACKQIGGFSGSPLVPGSWTVTWQGISLRTSCAECDLGPNPGIGVAASSSSFPAGTYCLSQTFARGYPGGRFALVWWACGPSITVTHSSDQGGCAQATQTSTVTTKIELELDAYDITGTAPRSSMTLSIFANVEVGAFTFGGSTDSSVSNLTIFSHNVSRVGYYGFECMNPAASVSMTNDLPISGADLANCGSRRNPYPDQCGPNAGREDVTEYVVQGQLLGRFGSAVVTPCCQ